MSLIKIYLFAELWELKEVLAVLITPGQSDYINGLIIGGSGRLILDVIEES